MKKDRDETISGLRQENDRLRAQLARAAADTEMDVTRLYAALIGLREVTIERDALRAALDSMGHPSEDVADG